MSIHSSPRRQALTHSFPTSNFRKGNRICRWAALLALLVMFSLATVAQTTNVSGDWVFHVTTDAGTGDPEFTLKQDGSKITGKYRGMLGEADVTGSVEGSDITVQFTISMGGGATIVYKGTVESAEKMKGTVDLGGQASGTWVAEKKK
ncbi:MAG: hypothetical protein U5J83_04065 [Bryobacterales bacterium]|nr:hypothetical protein [Bryobacterales bacterium]